MTQSDFLSAIIAIVALFMSLSFHEFLHAWTASYLGDPTAKAAGRVSLNPIAHIDPYGTILVPLVLIILRSPFVFGWAKPVPINPNNFKNPRIGSAVTALAGPMANLFLAILSAAIYKLSFIKEPIALTFLSYVVMINLVLMLFNLLPIPPLDGSKFFAYFFPILEDPRFEAYGPFILLAFIVLGGFTFISPIISLLLSVLGVQIGY